MSILLATVALHPSRAGRLCDEDGDTVFRSEKVRPDGKGTTQSVADDATTQKVYDNLNFMRGVEAFFNAIPGGPAEAIRTGWASQGADNNQTVIIMEDLMDSRPPSLPPTW